MFRAYSKKMFIHLQVSTLPLASAMQLIHHENCINSIW
uniref:Uncharacterized protein n=1 Tax=Rhizophora mucronata TaxID=61149 RepID=A0A2P2N5J7_RHIMU